MKPITATRISSLPVHFFTEYADRLSALRRVGADIIHLDVGSPDLPPPDAVINKLSDSAKHPDYHGYQSHRWTNEYREGWATMYQKLYGIQLDPDKEILPLIGSKEGIFHLMLAIIDPGDIVILPDPGYITYLRGVQIAGGNPFLVKLLPENGYLPDLSHIPPGIARRAKVIWLNYPNNPTGGTADNNFFTEVLDFAVKNGLLICHDAAYTQINFDDYQSPTILSTPGAQEYALEFNTLSKSHNMAGWRMGAAIGNQSALNALMTVKSNADSGHYLPMIDAAVEAMKVDQSWITSRNLVYQDRRDLVLDELHAMGFHPVTPQAGLYIWWKLPPGTDEIEFSTKLLEVTHVSITPGTVFGAEGRGFVRISLTQPTERVREAFDRIKNWMANGT